MLFAPIGQSIYTTLYESPGAHCFHCTYSHTVYIYFLLTHTLKLSLHRISAQATHSHRFYKYIYWQALQKYTSILDAYVWKRIPTLAHGTVGALFLPNLILTNFFRSFLHTILPS